MRVLDIGTREHTKVVTVDERGPGNANHVYEIGPAKQVDPGTDADFRQRIEFQNGPVKESGVNGIHNEDLIAIVIDRLDGFQSGEYACEANQGAKLSLEMAMTFLCGRTNARKARGVEGTSQL